MPASHTMSPKENCILRALPEEDYQRLLPYLEFTTMPLENVISEVGHRATHVYFPATSMVSLLGITDSGSTTEIAVMGHEGLVGVSLFMGGESMNSRASVESGGYGYRARADILMDEFRGGSKFQTLVLHFTQALTTQMSQTAVCNRHHNMEQIMCRWFLMSMDRVGTELKMTQQLISNMLGVRRESINEMATKLQDKGLINYRRGHISILDRKGLEEAACECYQVVKDEYERLLPCDWVGS